MTYAGAVRLCLLLCVLVGCYSPGYVDCKVGCAGGTCPNGLMCDPMNKMCRTEGRMGLACEQQDAGEGAEGMPSEAAIDGTPQGFCAAAGNAYVCHDFDDGLLEEQGWDSETRQGGDDGIVNVRLAPSTQSPPNALESSAGGASAGAVEAQEIDTFTVPLMQSFIVAWDMKVVAADDPNTVFTVLAGQGRINVATDGNGDITANSSPSGLSAPLTSTPPIGTWSHYSIDFVINSVSGLYNVTLHNGNQMVNLGTLSPPPTGGWEVRVGISGVGPEVYSEIEYDNVIASP